MQNPYLACASPEISSVYPASDAIVLSQHLLCTGYPSLGVVLLAGRRQSVCSLSAMIFRSLPDKVRLERSLFFRGKGSLFIRAGINYAEKVC